METCIFLFIYLIIHVWKSIISEVGYFSIHDPIWLSDDTYATDTKAHGAAAHGRVTPISAGISQQAHS